MKERVLSSLAKLTISAIAIVAVSACVLTFIVKIIENRVSRLNDYTYTAQSLNNKYLTPLEGGYWLLESVEDTLSREEISVSLSKLASVMDLLTGMNASYAYSYKNEKLASFWPMVDAKRILDTWETTWYSDYLLLQVVIPGLKKENAGMQSGSYSDSFKTFCKATGTPLPSLAMTSVEDFKYNESLEAVGGVAAGFPSIAYGLRIHDLTQDVLTLSKGRYLLRYKRSKMLPLDIAPISVYFHREQLQ